MISASKGVDDLNTAYIKYRLYQLEKPGYKVAEEMDITPEYFSSIINGKANPSLSTLEKLAKILGCNVKKLL